MADEKREITVKASAKGFYNGPRDPGDVFQMPEGSRGSWFKEVSSQPVGKKATVPTDEDLA